MKLFHGTSVQFDRFDDSFLGQNTDGNASDYYMAQTAHLGFWFSTSTDNLEDYCGGYIECEVELDNPYYVECLKDLAVMIQVYDKTGEEIRELLIEEGYDGIQIQNDEEFGATSYVAFSADQIEITNENTTI